MTTKPTRAGVKAALVHLGYDRFPDIIAASRTADKFTIEEREFGEYLIHDTDFGGAWNDSEQIAMNTTP